MGARGRESDHRALSRRREQRRDPLNETTTNRKRSELEMGKRSAGSEDAGGAGMQKAGVQRTRGKKASAESVANKNEKWEKAAVKKRQRRLCSSGARLQRRFGTKRGGRA